jgi:glycosyltransferase involved in cell wall biosynthesis
MKVVHVITGLNVGGAERTLYNLLSGGLGSPAQTTVISLLDEGFFGPLLQESGVSVLTLGLSRLTRLTSAIPRLRQLLGDLQPDLIQGWMYHGSLAATLTSWLAPGNPVLAWNIRHCLYSLYSEKFLTQQVIRATRHFSKHADLIIYNSQLAQQQHESFQFSASRSQVVANGFKSQNLLANFEQRSATRRSLGLSASGLVVGHVARYHPMKDHTSFLRAAKNIASSLPDVQFLLAGRDVSFANADLASIVPPHLRDRFYFVGEHNNVPALMAAMDVFCQSSWSEAFPNALGEAMAAGVPCVTTDVGDSALIIGETGIVIPPKNGSALTKGLLSMLTKSDQERQALGRMARSRIEDNYSLPVIVDKYKSLYQNIFDEKQGF